MSKLPGFKTVHAKYPGIAVWAANLNNATQARPQNTKYPKISTAIGQAVQSVLLGKASPSRRSARPRNRSTASSRRRDSGAATA